MKHRVPTESSANVGLEEVPTAECMGRPDRSAGILYHTILCHVVYVGHMIWRTAISLPTTDRPAEGCSSVGEGVQEV